MFEELLDLIKQYSTITIFRHVNADGDALGSSFGMKGIIESSFPDKKVYTLGQSAGLFQEQLFEENDMVSDEVISESLAIVLDTANRERIDDQRYSSAKKIVKIDHHIIVDSYGDLNIEFEDASSTSQIVTEWLHHFKDQLTIDEKSASYLYTGIVTDSGRFMYASTSKNTLMMAAFLLDYGVDLEAVTQKVYSRNASDLDVLRFIYSTYKVTPKGVAYYIMETADLEALNIDRQTGSSYVVTLAGIKEYPIWLAVTAQESSYRVSVRSRGYMIQPIAARFGGGGHAHACGLSVESLDDLDRLLQELDELI